MRSSDFNRPIVFFDGVCNLCNAVVQFIIKHDNRKKILFAPLQSALGKEVIDHVNKVDIAAAESIVLKYKNKYFIRSGAALHIAGIMGGAWKLLLVGFIFPHFIRDGIYDWVARNRYKWFGKRETCMLPTEEFKSRFLTE